MAISFQLSQVILGWFMLLCGIGMFVITVSNAIIHWYFYRKQNTKSKEDALKVNWNNVSDERVEFAYNEAVKELEDIEEARKKLDNKSLFFIGYLLVYVGGLLLQILPNTAKLIGITECSADVKVLLMLTGLAILNITILTISLRFLLWQQNTCSWRMLPKQSLIDYGNIPINQIIAVKITSLPQLNQAINYANNQHNRRSKLFNWITMLTLCFNLLIVSIFVIIVSCI